MLTSGATDNSTTQIELLDALGSVRNIQNLEQRYKNFVRDYKNTDVTELSLEIQNEDKNTND